MKALYESIGRYEGIVQVLVQVNYAANEPLAVMKALYKFLYKLIVQQMSHWPL